MILQIRKSGGGRILRLWPTSAGNSLVRKSNVPSCPSAEGAGQVVDLLGDQLGRVLGRWGLKNGVTCRCSCRLLALLREYTRMLSTPASLCARLPQNLLKLMLTVNNSGCYDNRRKIAHTSMYLGLTSDLFSRLLKENP